MSTLTDRREATAALLDALGRIIRTSRAASHRHQSDFSLTGTPLGILMALAVADARCGDLAVRLQVAPSVVSRALVPLEQAELVERRSDPADARAAQLGLTAAGRRQLDEARAAVVERVAPLLEDWDGDDLGALTELLDRLDRTLGSGLDLPLPHSTRFTNEGHA